MPLPIEPLALDAWPITVDAVGALKNLTDDDSSIPLPVGGYQIALVSSSTDGAFVKLGGTAAPPSTGSHADGAWLMPGVTYSLFVQTAADLHGIMVAGSATGKLRITKVR